MDPTPYRARAARPVGRPLSQECRPLVNMENAGRNRPLCHALCWA